MGMKPVRINMDLADVDPNGVFEDQTLGGAGDFTLDGAGVVNGEWVSPDGFAKQIGFESSGNISAVTFTVNGFEDEARNKPISETLSGPNNSTVETSNYFYVITSISADGAVGTNTEAGPVDESVTRTIPLTWRGGVVGINNVVTGTINYTVQFTTSDIQNLNSYPFTWVDSDDTDVISATTSQTSSFIAVPMAARVKINSYSSGAALDITIFERDE